MRKKISHILLSATIFMTLLATATSTVTFQPPPPINSSTIATISKPAGSADLVTSKRIESLSIVNTDLGGGNYVTTFKLDFFNRSAASGNINTYTITNEPGNWVYIKGTTNTLSCSLIHELITDSYGLLQFKNDLGVFQIVSRIPKANLPAAAQALDANTIGNNFLLSDQCVAGSLFGMIYRLSADGTQLNTVNLPANWVPLAASESFVYGVSQGKLYRFNDNTLQYEAIYTFGSHQSYYLADAKNRLMVIGYTTTANTAPGFSGKFIVRQTVYLLEDEGGAVATVLQTFELNSDVHNADFIMVMNSKELTKVGGAYVKVGEMQATVFGKSIDYFRNTVLEMTFTEPAMFLTTVQGGQVDFSDFYLVVRNHTNLVNNAGGTPVEQAYQFVGDKIINFRERDLTGLTAEMTTWRKMYIDLAFKDRLILLNVYQQGDGSYKVDEFSYGNLAANKKPVVQAANSFIEFTEPTHTQKYSENSWFTWGYFNQAAGPTTALTVYKVNVTQANNYKTYTYNFNANVDLIAQNDICKVLYDSTNTAYTIHIYNEGSDDYVQIDDISAAVGTITVTGSTKWKINKLCDKFSADSHVFVKNQAGSFVQVTAFNWLAIDQSLTHAIVGNQIWKYDPTTNAFASVHTLPTLGTDKFIQTSLGGKVVVYSTSATGVVFLAYIFVGTQAQLCLNYTFNGYTAAPLVQVSPMLTKAFFLGPVSGTPSMKMDAFFVNYTSASYQNITLPEGLVRNPEKTYIQLDDKFMYVRQIFDNAQAGNQAYVDNQQQEFIYFIDKDVNLLLNLKRNLTKDQADTWVKTLILMVDNKFLIAVESLTGASAPKTVVVHAAEVSAAQANLNNMGTGIAGIVVNGFIRLCVPGCQDCSSGVCSRCGDGSSLDQASGLCFPCRQNCDICSSDDPDTCTICFEGTYLEASNNTCLPCYEECITCTGPALADCSGCPPGEYFGNNQCLQCPKNCLVCDANGCLDCREGFTVVESTGTCRGCSLKCSSCNPYNITECTGCAQGLQLNGSLCINCPVNCLSCAENICSVCKEGYIPNDNGVCVQSCQFPCFECEDNQPTNCTSCYSGSTLTGDTCVLDLSCNADSSCTDCGQGQGYVLAGSSCIQCQTGDVNCVQCSQSNPQDCSLCKKGFYVGDSDGFSVCLACNTKCVSCVSSSICTGCAAGYYLPENKTEGSCLACQSPCVQCRGSATYCTKCADGYTQKIWKCQNNKFVGFKITLNTDMGTILTNIDTIIASILQLIGQNSGDIQAVTIESVTTGSAVLTGSATPSSGDPTVAAALLSSGSSLGGYTITGSQVTAEGVSSSEEESKVGLIVGLTVGLVVLVAVIVIVAVVIYKKRQTNNTKVTDSQKNENNNFKTLQDSTLNPAAPSGQFGVESNMQVEIKNMGKEEFE